MQVDHEPDELTRGQVLSGILVEWFGEITDNFLEDCAASRCSRHQDGGRYTRTFR